MTSHILIDQTLASLVSIAQAAEARNRLTENHSELVAMVAQGIGRHLGLSDETLDRLMLMARLHNIGIVGTRDSVLIKTDPLSGPEFTHIENHTQLGATFLAPFESLADAAEVCLTHHERWNGTGYPNGISGTDIPLAARIIGVADTYTAIISERPHRDSMPRPVAAEMIQEDRGIQLCPECVDAFMKWFAETEGRIYLPDNA